MSHRVSHPLLVRLAAGLWLAMILLLSSTAAWASEEEAAEVDARAREAFGEGQFEEAARLFAKANAIEPAAITKYNEGFSWEKAGRYAPQADAYEEARKLGTLDADRDAHARERLVELERRLGILVVKAPERARVTVAHAEGRLVPSRIHLLPGQYEVRAVTPAGKEHRRTIDVVQGDSTYLSFPADPVAKAPVTPVDPDEGRRQMHYIAGGTMVAIGAIGGAMSVVFGAQFLDTLGDFDDGGRTDPDLRDRALDLRLAANIALGVGLAFAGGGIAVVLTAPSTPEADAPPEASWSIHTSGQGLWLEHRW